MSGLLAHCRMYATAAARSDGLLLLCGGRDAEGVPLGDAYGLARHRDGRWEWAAAPGAQLCSCCVKCRQALRQPLESVVQSNIAAWRPAPMHGAPKQA